MDGILRNGMTCLMRNYQQWKFQWKGITINGWHPQERDDLTGEDLSTMEISVEGSVSQSVSHG